MFKKILPILLSLSLVLGLCYINATKINTQTITVREEKLISDKLNADQDNLLIAYFSDLHYGNYIDQDFLNKVVETINESEPDVIIFSGDLIDKPNVTPLSSTQENELIEGLSKMNAKYGKYYVLGNHDLINADIKANVSNILSQGGFISLTNTNVILSTNQNSAINIVGIDSSVSGNPDPTSAFNGINTSNYTLVVSHCPDYFDEILDYNFDYMLSGHSHGGQIYIPIVSYFKRESGCMNYFKGKHENDGKTLDITNGVGRSRINARFLADSEIVLYTLVSSKTDTEA